MEWNMLIFSCGMGSSLYLVYSVPTDTWAVKRLSISMLLHKFYILATHTKLKIARSQVIHMHPSHFCLTLTYTTNPFNVSTSCGWFPPPPVSHLMILERSVQPYVDRSNKNYTKEEYTPAIDYPQGPIVYYEEASGSKNYVCHCVAWPTLSKDRLIIWKKPWNG